ncbi:hypothetical protein [Accumulibacter sp.]|uniref:hypothetical protein n=1 Tax=Accumulibacter sp. TaxID=2053492 RepID=UPI00258FDB54|nr:hypothetical protein [Accumulibacter sp.]
MLPRQRQSLLFSATFPEEIKKLADGMLQSPVADRGRQAQHGVGNDHPPGPSGGCRGQACAAGEAAEIGRLQPVLVFTRTKIETNKLAREL